MHVIPFSGLTTLTNYILSPQNVFLGPSGHRKGYRCLLEQSDRLYIVKDVKFVESEFPYVSLFPPYVSRSLSYSPSQRHITFTHMPSSLHTYVVNDSSSGAFADQSVSVLNPSHSESAHHQFSSSLLSSSSSSSAIPCVSPIPISTSMSLSYHHFMSLKILTL